MVVGRQLPPEAGLERVVGWSLSDRSMAAIELVLVQGMVYDFPFQIFEDALKLNELHV